MRLFSLKKVRFALVAAAGLVTGAAFAPNVAQGREYCEEDACLLNVFCVDVAGMLKTGCDRLGSGGCYTYSCNEE